MPPALANSVNLWFVDPDNVSGATLHAAADLLSPDELARGKRFRLPILRRDYLITRWLVRTILSERLSVPARALRFGSNAYGRPYLPTHPELSFNISHTNGLIALAVAQAGEIGMDIERLQTDRATPKLADECFAASERAALHSVTPDSFDEMFFTYWTLKESYIKALGTGLSTALDTFSFELGNPKSIGFTPSQSPDLYAPHFWLIGPRPTHLCAVCVRLSPQELALNAWDVVPLVSTTALDLTVMRRSTA